MITPIHNNSNHKWLHLSHASSHPPPLFCRSTTGLLYMDTNMFDETLTCLYHKSRMTALHWNVGHAWLRHRSLPTKCMFCLYNYVVLCCRRVGTIQHIKVCKATKSVMGFVTVFVLYIIGKRLVGKLKLYFRCLKTSDAQIFNPQKTK